MHTGKTRLIPTHRELCNLGVEEDSIIEIEKEEITDGIYNNQLSEMEWPKPETVTKGVTTLNDADTHSQHLERLNRE